MLVPDSELVAELVEAGIEEPSAFAIATVDADEGDEPVLEPEDAEYDEPEAREPSEEEYREMAVPESDYTTPEA